MPELDNDKYNYYMESLVRCALNENNVKRLLTEMKFVRDLDEYLAIQTAWSVYCYEKDKL